MASISAGGSSRSAFPKQRLPECLSKTPTASLSNAVLRLELIAYGSQGKTTTILGLIKQLPKDYKVVLLKNEYGDVEGTS